MNSVFLAQRKMIVITDSLDLSHELPHDSSIILAGGLRERGGGLSPSPGLLLHYTHHKPYVFIRPVAKPSYLLNQSDIDLIVAEVKIYQDISKDVSGFFVSPFDANGLNRAFLHTLMATLSSTSSSRELWLYPPTGEWSTCSNMESLEFEHNFGALIFPDGDTVEKRLQSVQDEKDFLRSRNINRYIVVLVEAYDLKRADLFRADRCDIAIVLSPLTKDEMLLTPVPYKIWRRTEALLSAQYLTSQFLTMEKSIELFERVNSVLSDSECAAD